MENDPRIVELLSDMLHEQRTTNQRLEKVEYEIIGLQKQQARTNAGIGELSLSVMKLAEKFEIVSQHDKRITRLEETVFHA